MMLHSAQYSELSSDVIFPAGLWQLGCISTVFQDIELKFFVQVYQAMFSVASLVAFR